MAITAHYPDLQLATACSNEHITLVESLPGSTWVYTSRKCQLSGQAEPAAAYPGGLYMQHVEEDPLGPDPQPVDPLAPDCEAALGECEQALQQCQNSDAEENGLQISCPGEHNSVVTAGGKVFRIFCNQALHSSTNLGQLGWIPSFGRCTELCSAITGCVQAQFTAGGTCRLRSVGQQSDLVPIAGYNTALVEA